MYSVKAGVFSYLTKKQKSSLVNYLKLFVKRNFDLLNEQIIEEFLEEEKYYLECENPHYSWVFDYIEEENFFKELNLYIEECKDILRFKERQKPFLEQQKLLAKKMRQEAKLWKMSKEKPTLKQTKYYKKLCEKYKLEILLNEENTRLDFYNKINEIIEKFCKNEKQNN